MGSHVWRAVGVLLSPMCIGPCANDLATGSVHLTWRASSGGGGGHMAMTDEKNLERSVERAAVEELVDAGLLD